MSDKEHINEDELEKLLRDYSLENTDDKLAEAIMLQNYETPVNKAKEEAMLKKLDKSLNGGGGFKPFIYAGIIVLMVIALAIYFAATKSDGTKRAVVESEHHPSMQTLMPATEDSLPIERVEKLNLTELARQTDTFGKTERLYTAVLPADSILQQTEIKPAEKKTVLATLLPVLPEKDKIRYAQIKKQMLEKLYKADKDLYTHAYANMTEYMGENIEVNAFTIRNVTITNLEYKTFLADLIMQGKAQEYYASEVLTLKWKTEGCEDLATQYFQDDKYNDFPVVNITREGATNFCKWIEGELREYISDNKLKGKDFEIRLPQDKEWIMAVRDGYAKISYEAGYNTMYDIKEGLIDASFIKRLNQINKRYSRKDTIYPYYIVNRYGWKEADIKNFLDKAFAAYSYLPADTIYPKRMKLFGKIGHLSEMVPQQKPYHLWLPGLTWKSKEEYAAFENKFNQTKASPFVSFRFVIIDKNDAGYKNPFW